MVCSVVPGPEPEGAEPGRVVEGLEVVVFVGLVGLVGLVEVVRVVPAAEVVGADPG